MNWKKGVIAGVVAGIVLNIISFVFGMLPGKQEWYVATFPQMMNSQGLAAMFTSMFLIGVFMGIIYDLINDSLPGNKTKKGFVYGIIVWLLAGTMWPVMMMGFASTYQWLSELLIGLVEYIFAGTVVVYIYGKK
jgi:predicted membrane channel-forming protein YqfA (hemolysin III family)